VALLPSAAGFFFVHRVGSRAATGFYGDKETSLAYYPEKRPDIMAFKSNLETPEAEAARLAQAPEGSTNHALSSMPVNIHGRIQDLMIELPSFEGDPKHTIVVVPFYSDHYGTADDPTLPRRRYNYGWTCIVIASDDPRCKAAGHRVSIPEYQLRRGTLRTLPSAIEEALAQPLTIESATNAGLLTVREPIAAPLEIQ
jgi:hypothetical protein